MNWKQRSYVGFWVFIFWVALGYAGSRANDYSTFEVMIYFLEIFVAIIALCAFIVGAMYLYSVLGDKEEEEEQTNDAQ